MPEPFKPKDALWRWKPTEECRKSWGPALADEYVFAKVPIPGDLYRYATYERHSDGWHVGGSGTLPMIAELLHVGMHLKEQLHDAGEKRKELLRRLAKSRQRCEKAERLLAYIKEHWDEYAASPTHETSTPEHLILELCLTQVFYRPDTIPAEQPQTNK